jgi:hypothetical protein
VTEVVAKKSLRAVRVMLGILIGLVVFLVILVGLLLPRTQRSADRAQRAATRTEVVLLETIAAVQAGSPQAAYTRAQIDALCQLILAEECPPTPPPVPITTAVSQ